MNELINVLSQDGTLVVSSREVSRNFEKRHDHILRDISQLIEDMGSPQSWGHLFMASAYNDSYGREQREYLLTRDGFTLLAMGFTGKKALAWKLKYIDAFNKMENLINKPIPTDLQVLQGMLNKLIQQETEIKVISEQTQAIKNTIVAEYDNWREEIKRQINTIQKKSSMTYQDTYNTLYDSLEKRGRCDLSARVRNGRDRLADSGATKTKIEAFGRMDVIEADARLREIFTTIVKEYAVKYVA